MTMEVERKKIFMYKNFFSNYNISFEFNENYLYINITITHKYTSKLMFTNF